MYIYIYIYIYVYILTGQEFRAYVYGGGTSHCIQTSRIVNISDTLLYRVSLTPITLWGERDLN